MSLGGAAAVVGVGELRPARLSKGTPMIDLMADAASAALADAGLRPADIDGLLVHPVPGVSMFAPAFVIEALGIRASFAECVDLGGASGAGMVWRAAAAIDAGMCSTCLCVTAGTSQTYPGRDQSPGATPPRSEGGANAAYAQIARRYAHEYRLADAQRARIAVHQRENALANPEAIFHGQPIAIDDVLASPVIAEPLHRLEIVMPCEGAAAVVVTSAAQATSLSHPPAYLLGAGEACHFKSLAMSSDVLDTAVRPAADRAFAMAGIRRDQVGLASVYDCYTITVILTLEDAGFCPKGSGGSFVDEHDLRYFGDFPLNTHGGQLSFGQAGVAGGMSHVVEAVRQLQGRAGERQVKALEHAFVHGNGGAMSEQVSLLLSVSR